MAQIGGDKCQRRNPRRTRDAFARDHRATGSFGNESTRCLSASLGRSRQHAEDSVRIPKAQRAILVTCQTGHWRDCIVGADPRNFRHRALGFEPVEPVARGSHLHRGVGIHAQLLIGGLGICFVSQRCVEDFSTSRLHSIARVSLVLGSVALFLTTLGVLLAMVWAKIEWGRYWAWDSKEIGGLSVVVWLACYLVAHRFFKSSERGVLAISMLGNIVVILAWFGPQVNGLHRYGTANTSLLLTIAILVNLAFFAIGFVPAGRLRLRN